MPTFGARENWAEAVNFAVQIYLLYVLEFLKKTLHYVLRISWYELSAKLKLRMMVSENIGFVAGLKGQALHSCEISWYLHPVTRSNIQKTKES